MRDPQEQINAAAIQELVAAAHLPAGMTEALTREFGETATFEAVRTRIFETMARESAAQPDQRSGLAVQRGDSLGQIEQMAGRIVERDGITKEAAVVQVLNKNPKLYDQYLQAHPHQTGHR